MSCSRLHRADLSHTPKPRSQRRRSPAGHTLIEILLALGLSLVILAAAYTALHQHGRYADAGQRQTEQMQVTRALFERLSLDLRSVVFRHAAGLDRALGTGDTTRIEVAQTDEHYLGRSVGIVGDNQTLVLRIDAPSDESSAGPQSVRWEVRSVESNPSDGSDAATSRTAAAPASASKGKTLGLARIIQGAATLTAGSLKAADKLSASELLAEEVETIRFRYFARGSWSDRWDSVERQELPQAVEITIGFREAPLAETTTSGQAHPGEYRLLVPVPASEA